MNYVLVNHEGSVFARIVAGLRRAHRRRVAMRELESLSPRLLADIGVERADIPAVVDAMIAETEAAAAPREAGGAFGTLANWHLDGGARGVA